MPMPRLLRALLLLFGLGLLFSVVNFYNVQNITIAPHGPNVNIETVPKGNNVDKRVNTDILPVETIIPAATPIPVGTPIPTIQFVQKAVAYKFLHGYIDDFNGDKVHGWACFPTVDQPVTVRIVDDTTKTVVGETFANRERVDLATNGVCTGPRHGWMFYFEEAWARGKHDLAFYALFQPLNSKPVIVLLGVRNVTILAPPVGLTVETSKSGLSSRVEWQNTSSSYDVAENGLVTKVKRINQNNYDFAHEANAFNFVLVRERNGFSTGQWTSNMQSFPNVYNSEESFFPQFAHNQDKSKLNNKKVLIWTHNLHLEGAPICAYQLAVFLKDRGVDVSVQAGGNGTLYTYLRANSIDVIFGNAVKSPERYDIVIMNTITAAKVLELQPELWPKAVWWIHEQEPRLLKLFNMNLLKEVRMAVFPTRGCLHMYKEWNHGHFVVIPNGVDLTRRDRILSTKTRIGFRRGLKIMADDFVVTLHGTFAPNKGQLGLLEVANKLKYHNIKFLLVGATEGLEEYHKQLFEYITKNKLHKVMLFYKNPFVDLFYGSTDLHISNTQQTESFGLTLIEAMSFGVPVVAPDLQGMSGIVQHNKTGFLFPPTNVDKLAEWILYMKNNPSHAARMGGVAKSYVENTYSLSIVMRKYEDALANTF